MKREVFDARLPDKSRRSSTSSLGGRGKMKRGASDVCLRRKRNRRLAGGGEANASQEGAGLATLGKNDRSATKKAKKVRPRRVKINAETTEGIRRTKQTEKRWGRSERRVALKRERRRGEKRSGEERKEINGRFDRRAPGRNRKRFAETSRRRSESTRGICRRPSRRRRSLRQ